MTFSRSACPHGDPAHPLPVGDQAAWRRFLAHPDLYVVHEDSASAASRGLVIEQALASLETLRSLLVEEPRHSLGSTVVSRDDHHAMLHHQMETGSFTKVELNLVHGDLHTNLTIEIPDRWGPWSICAPADGATERLMRTRMERIHRVFCAHLRMMRRQRRARERAEEDARWRRDATKAYALPIMHDLDPRRTNATLASPWGGPFACHSPDPAVDGRVARELATTPFGTGTRLRAGIRRFAAKDDRGPINTIEIQPVRELVDATSLDAVECMRAAVRMETMPTLTPLYA